MKSKTILTLLCVLVAAIAVAVAGQHYYGTLAPAASALSSDGHEHAHDDQTGHTLDDQAGRSQDGQVEYAHDEAQPEPDLLSRYDVEI
ncbi:MAG: hypothetical protein ACYTBS_11175, partial [Planctomycetota bacterium]